MLKKGLFLVLCISIFFPISVYAGLRMLSDCDSIDGNNWQDKYIQNGALMTNTLYSNQCFQGDYCLEYRVHNIQNWGSSNRKAYSKWYTYDENWTNYGKLVFVIKPTNIYTGSTIDNNYNISFEIKEYDRGASDYNAEVWQYFYTNQALTSSSWYLIETDLVTWHTNDFNGRMNEFHDASFDNNVYGDKLPPGHVDEIDLVFSTGNASALNNQRILFDFVALLSTPYSLLDTQTGCFPMTTTWTDVAPNHPLFQIQIMTNNTNSTPVVDTLITGAENIDSLSFDSAGYNLKPYYKYYWQIRAGYIVSSAYNFYSGTYKKINPDGSQITINSCTTLWSYYSSPAVISNTGIPALSAGSFLPQDGDNHYGVTTLPFAWQNLKEEGADCYIFSVSSNQDFSSVITTVTLSSTNYTVGVTGNFEKGSNYFYSVWSGYTNYDSTVIWDKVTTNQFTFGFAPPVLISPADNDTINEHPYTFTWNNVYSGVTYEMQISKTSSFAEILDSQQGVELGSYSMTFSQEKYKSKGPYFWRVKSDNAGSIDYSDTFSFYLDLGLDVVKEFKLYPTHLTKNDSVKIKVLSDLKPNINKIKVLFLDPHQNVISSKEYTANDISDENVLEVPLNQTGIEKGFYFVYVVFFNKDNSTDKSKPLPLIIQ